MDNAELPEEPGVFTTTYLSIDAVGHQAKLGQADINLTLKEFDILLLFVKEKGKVVTRSQLLQQVWGSNQTDSDRTINVHICRLRKKIEPDPGHPSRLVSIRGVGYRLKD